MHLVFRHEGTGFNNNQLSGPNSFVATDKKQMLVRTKLNQKLYDSWPMLIADLEAGL